MERSSFFNAELVGEEYDRVYLAEDYARYFASFIGNGVFPNPATGLQVTTDSASMNVIIKVGKAWIDGYFYENTDDLTLKVDVADGVLNRIDKVVLRLDFINREIKAYIKKGNFASSPTAPTVQRDADMYEIALADVRVNKGVTSISQSNITDLRLNTELCGIVHGVVDQVDTTAIFNQFEDWYSAQKANYDNDIAKWTTEKKEAFDTWYNTNTEAFLNQFNTWYSDNTSTWEENFNNWFETIKGQLDGDIAANLSTQIIKLQNEKISFKVDNSCDIETPEMVQKLDNINKKYNEVIGRLNDTELRLDKKANETDGARLTTDKTVTGAINELFTNVSNGKKIVANAITDKGVIASESNTFNELATKIGQIKIGAEVTINNKLFDGNSVKITSKIIDEYIYEVSEMPYSFTKGCAVVYDNEIHILGCYSYGSYHYKWNGTTWIEVSTIPYKFYQGCAVVYNNEIHILGGYDSKTHHYKCNGKTWSKVSTLPYELSEGCAVVYNNEIHIMGGYGYNLGTNHYKWNGKTWSKASTLPYEFQEGSSVVYNNEIHIMGGYEDTISTNHYKWNGSTWTSVSTLPIKFYEKCAVVYNNEIRLSPIGIYGDTSNYYFDGTTWIERLKVEKLSMYDGCMLVYKNEIHILGGNNNNNGKGHFSNILKYEVVTE